MSKTILADVEGFTPLIDAIVQEEGVMAAAVFGRIWRYCQGERGVCDASLETIANELGISYRTVLRHAKELVEAKYLEDLTPDLRHKPHTYADTGRAQIVAKISGMTKSQTRSDKLSQEGLTESQLKIQGKRQVKKDLRTSSPAIQAVYEVTGRFPSKDVYDVIIKTLGETPDVERLRSCFQAWRLKDYKPTNLGWVTEWYVSGIPTNGRAPAPAQTLPTGYSHG